MITLGDEIEDVTAKVRGICIGKTEYLDGSKAYLMQPPYDDNGNRINLVEVQEAYARKVGVGVRLKTAPKRTGFHVEETMA